MKSGAITIKDIAKALNLSSSTVSRALKGSYKISEPIIQKIKAYAEAHHYKPNLLAQSLKNKRSRSIGVMLCNIPNNFFAEVINGIESVASDKDYYVIVSQSHESYQKEIKMLRHLDWRSVDGLIVSLSAETEDVSHFQEMIDNGVPVVFFDRVPEAIKTHKVVSDNAQGAFDVTAHLVAAGYKRIAQVTSPPHISITVERLDGYKRALQHHGIPFNEAYVKYCPHGGMERTEIETAMNELLSMPNPPDAVIAASDRLSIGCFSILKKHAIAIPGQMALVGFSNFSAPELFYPPLTTVVQPAFEIGRTATELLLQLIESKRPVKLFEKKVLPNQLFIRESSRRPPDV